MSRCRCFISACSAFPKSKRIARRSIGIGDRRPSGPSPVRVYFTIEVGAPEAVDAAAALAATHGGAVIKPPYTTYYNARQAVLEDPEGNVFRVNHRMGPRQPAAEIANPPWKKAP